MSTRPTTTSHRRPSAEHVRDTRDAPAGLEPPVAPAGAVENARDTLGVDRRSAEGAFPTTPWTPQTAPTGSTGNLVLALDHDITNRISKIRCDNHGRELTEQRRYAPTSIPLRRNPCSRSPELRSPA